METSAAGLCGMDTEQMRGQHVEVLFSVGRGANKARPDASSQRFKQKS